MPKEKKRSWYNCINSLDYCKFWKGPHSLKITNNIMNLQGNNFSLCIHTYWNKSEIMFCRYIVLLISKLCRKYGNHVGLKEQWRTEKRMYTSQKSFGKTSTRTTQSRIVRKATHFLVASQVTVICWHAKMCKMAADIWKSEIKLEMGLLNRIWPGIWRKGCEILWRNGWKD